MGRVSASDPKYTAFSVGAAVVAASVAASVAYSKAKPIWGRGSGQEEGEKGSKN